VASAAPYTTATGGALPTTLKPSSSEAQEAYTKGCAARQPSMPQQSIALCERPEPEAPEAAAAASAAPNPLQLPSANPSAQQAGNQTPGDSMMATATAANAHVLSNTLRNQASNISGYGATTMTMTEASSSIPHPTFLDPTAPLQQSTSPAISDSTNSVCAAESPPPPHDNQSTTPASPTMDTLLAHHTSEALTDMSVTNPLPASRPPQPHASAQDEQDIAYIAPESLHHGSSGVIAHMDDIGGFSGGAPGIAVRAEAAGRSTGSAIAADGERMGGASTSPLISNPAAPAATDARGVGMESPDADDVDNREVVPAFGVPEMVTNKETERIRPNIADNFNPPGSSVVPGTASVATIRSETRPEPAMLDLTMAGVAVAPTTTSPYTVQDDPTDYSDTLPLQPMHVGDREWTGQGGLPASSKSGPPPEADARRHRPLDTAATGAAGVDATRRRCVPATTAALSPYTVQDDAADYTDTLPLQSMPGGNREWAGQGGSPAMTKSGPPPEADARRHRPLDTAATGAAGVDATRRRCVPATTAALSPYTVQDEAADNTDTLPLKSTRGGSRGTAPLAPPSYVQPPGGVLVATRARDISPPDAVALASLAPADRGRLPLHSEPHPDSEGRNIDEMSNKSVNGGSGALSSEAPTGLEESEETEAEPVLVTCRSLSAPASMLIDEQALDVIAFRMALRQPALRLSDPRYISLVVRAAAAHRPPRQG
jgi:hypothetical protein